VLAAGGWLAPAVAGGTGLILVLLRMALKRRAVDVALLLVTAPERPPGEPLARRFTAAFAAANGFVLARRSAGFARLSHA
jgi:hypothetical protein